MDSPITIGRFGKPYGIKGWVRVQSFTQPVKNIINYGSWKILQGNKWQELKITASRWHEGKLMVHIAGFDDAEQAKFSLTGKPIVIFREQLPPLAVGEFYWADLQGMNVVNQQGVVLGVVDYLFESGANDILVVKENQKERLIPYIKEQVIKHIDLVNRRIEVDWDPDF